MRYKVTHETYVRTNDYNDYVVAKDGTLHAQGSHDINRTAKCYNEDGTKAAWHREQSNRKRQYWHATKRAAGLRKVRYAKCGRKTWAVNARVNDDNEIVVCDGYTNRNPNRKSGRSRLGQICDK